MNRAPELRSDLYAALAWAFGNPGSHFLTRGLDNRLVQALEMAAGWLPVPSFKPEAAELNDFIDQNAGDGTQALNRLEAEYHWLFVIHPQVAPYESVFRNPEGMTMRESAVGVSRRYAEDGLSLSRGFKDLPDHICAELEYMAYLCAQEAVCWQGFDVERAGEYSKRACVFLREHCSIWIPDFCRKVRSVTKSRFYASVASITKAFLEWETDRERNETSSPPVLWHIDVDEGKCIMCHACAEACAAKSLTVSQGDTTVELLANSALCNGCGICRKLCPQGALTIAPTAFKVMEEMRVVARSDMVQCGQCGKPFVALAALGRIGGVTLLCDQCKRKRMQTGFARDMNTRKPGIANVGSK